MDRSRLIRGGIAACVAAFLALWAFGPAMARGARSLDLLGMLREIGRTNEEIGEVNDSILASLGDVRQEVERVTGVRERLGTMEGLLGEQQAQLDKLRATTGRQAQLSQELKELTATAGPATASMARTAAAEAGTLEGMRDATGRLAGQLQSVRTANISVAAKLDRAELLSATVLTRMP